MSNENTKTLNKKNGVNLGQYGILLALFAIVVIFQFLTGGKLLLPNNFVSLIQQNAYVLVLATGMVMVIVATHIDLSVGSGVALIGGICAIMMTNMHLNFFLAIVLCLVIGLLVGAWQGFWIAYVGVPAFITTLGGMLIFRGLSTALVGQSVPVTDESFRTISKGFLPNIFGFVGTFDILTLLVGILTIVGFIAVQAFKRNLKLASGLPTDSGIEFLVRVVIISLLIGGVTFLLAQSGNEKEGGIPIVLVIVAILIVVFNFIFNRTSFGRHIYAVGGNRKAAILSGINAKQVDFKIFLSMGFLSAVAGILMLSRLSSASASTGQNFELDAIAACFIGGTAVTGGIGTIPGAMIGAMVMGVINQGLSIMGVSAEWVSVIKGLVLLLAVAFDLLSKKRK